jgi:hypothetical protein
VKKPARGKQEPTAPEAPAPDKPAAAPIDPNLRALVGATADRILDGIDVTAPTELADAVEIYNRLRAALPPDTLVDAYHRRTAIVVEIRSGNLLLYTRIMEAR